MNILITLSYYLPNVSGLTNYVKNLSEYFASKNHGVLILTSRHQNNLQKEEECGRVTVHRVWSPIAIGRGVLMPTYFMEAINAVKHADVVNIHLPQFEGFVTAIIARVLRKKIIVTYHCDLSFWKGVLNIISTTLVYLSNFITCLLADKIVTNSQDYADNSWFLGLFKKKLAFIYPPVVVKKAKSKVLNKYKNIKYKIGYVGRISKEKGVGYLLESAKYLKEKLPDFKIFLVGPKSDIIGGSQVGEIEGLLKKYKKYIIELGKLTDEELFGFYKEIDVLVLPSVERQESFGMVQIEAMAKGCPVVVTDLPGVRIPVKQTKMGIVVTINNVKDLAKAIVKILTNKRRYVKNNKLIIDLFNNQSKYLELLK